MEAVVDRLLQEHVADEGWLSGDVVSTPSRPRRICSVASVERVMDDDLAPFEALDMRTADADVLRLS
jgi:hypothetical protein